MSTSFQKHPVSSFFIFFVCSFKQKTCTRVAIVEKEPKSDPLRGILTRSPFSDPCHGELPTSLPSPSCKPRSPRLYVCLLMVPLLQQPRIKPCFPRLYVWLLQLFRLLPPIVAKKRDPGILDPEPFLAQIRKVEARLGKLAKIRKSVIN